MPGLGKSGTSRISAFRWSIGPRCERNRIVARRRGVVQVSVGLRALKLTKGSARNAGHARLLLHGPPQDLFDLTFRVPSECADLVASGAADIGNIPAIEMQRQNLQMVPGLGVASRGAVRSILLVSKRPLAAIRTLAADSSSRTSVALTRIILSRRYGAEPEIHPYAPDLAAMLDHADAALIIG